MSNSKYCVKCGKQIPKSTKFCPYCGTQQPMMANNTQQTSASAQSAQPTRVQRNTQRASQQTAAQQPTGSTHEDANFRAGYRAAQNNAGYQAGMKEAFANPFNAQGKRYITPKPVGMLQAFKLFWMRYIDFKGYSSRAEYWWWFLWEVIINIVLWIIFVSTELGGMISSLMDGTSGVNFAEGPLGIIMAIGSFGFAGVLILLWELGRLVPNVALKVRRFRDAGVPIGWTIALLVINFIPFIDFFSAIACFIISLMPSVRKGNQQ